MDKKDLIFIAVLIALVAALILTRGCGTNQTQGIDRELIYDSIERVIKSKMPPPQEIIKVTEKDVIRWLPQTVRVDTLYLQGEEVYSYVDTNAIISHYLNNMVTYTDTIEDSSLQAVIQDTIFRNSLVGRGFRYKWKAPTEIRYIDNRDKFQLIASAQFGIGATYTNNLNGVYGGVDVGLKFKSGTYFSLGYMAGTSHFGTVRVGQVIRLRK